MIIKAIISFLAIVVVSVIFIQRISNNKVTIGGYGIYTIVTESMVPKYNVYDMIIVKKTDFSNVNVGDDVVYMGEKSDFAGKIVTHQVVSKEVINGITYFHTKGIANDLEDPLVSQKQIIGTVKFKSNILSFISSVVNNPYGFYFVIFVPFAILLVMEIIDVNEERREKKRKHK